MQQSKGLITFFLVLLLIICAGQFLYYFPTNKVEKAADAYAQRMSATAAPENRATAVKEYRSSYLDSMSSEKVWSMPLIGSYTYQELKSKQLALGLDLKGGMSVLLRVDLKDFLNSLSGKSEDLNFKKALENASVRQKESQSDYIQIFVEEFEKIAGKGQLANVFARNPSLKNILNLGSTDAQVQTLIRQKADETVNETYNRLKERIDKLGVVQPNVFLDKNRDIIQVELPGIENPERARHFLEASANLEFWEVYRTTDEPVFKGIVDADNMLKAAQLGISADSVSKDTSNQKKSGPILSAFIPNQQQQGSAIIGYTDKNKKKLLTDYFSRPEIKAKFPRDLEFRWSKDAVKDKDGKSTGTYELFALKRAAGKEGAALSGESVINAQARPSEKGGGNYEISMTMNPQGAAAWGQLTTKAANDNKREVAIVLDSEVVSAPSVINPILGGSSSITGQYGPQEAKDMASILEVGKLPARAEIIQESTVGPTLGAQNIRSSMLSLGISFLAILAFMWIYYSTGGIISIIALFANLFFIIGMLTSKGTVLTLPGIAGIVLTMGMAVDANVIIYERIREELNAGKNMQTAISEGFRHAFSAIIDGNVTALIAALVLWAFGLGPIKGFGIVLAIGIIFTLFTAFVLTRLLVDFWVQKGWPLKFWAPFSEKAFKNINVDWMKLRRPAYLFSAAIIVAGIIAMFTRGFELGVDFKGGYSYTVRFDKPVNADNLRSELTKSFDNQSTVVKSVSTENTYNITTSYLVKDNSTSAQAQVEQKLFEGINASVDGGTLNIDNFKKSDALSTHIISSTKVGPTVADDIKNSSTKAAIIGLLGIAAFILLRFRRWQYSLGAIVATIHDALITLSVFALLHGILPFSLEIDQALVAAILTILGYSINDTVIVYDRIREYMSNNVSSGKTMSQVINLAINSVFSRTIITSVIILMVLLILFIFGGSGLRGFSFALLIGIAAGTYSSVFIAAPIMLDFSKNLDLSEYKPQTTVTTAATSKPVAVVTPVKKTLKAK